MDNTESHSHNNPLTIQHLWQASEPTVHVKVFAVLDGAKDKRIEPAINNSRLQHTCLYTGKLSYALKRAAPHLVELEADHPFTEKLLHDGWGKNWGIFIQTPASTRLSSVRDRCRRLSRVTAPDQKKLVFRYYDPRVLNTYIPTCTTHELNHLFGAGHTIFAEDENGNTIRRFDWDKHNEVLQIKTWPAHLDEMLADIEKTSPQPGEKIHNFLRIRAEQIEALTRHLRQQEFQSLLPLYLESYEYNQEDMVDFCGQPLPIQTFLSLCHQKAAQFELESTFSLLQFFNLCIQYGWSFWNQEPYVWVRDILESSRPDDAKIETINRKLSLDMMDQLWK